MRRSKALILAGLLIAGTLAGSYAVAQDQDGLAGAAGTGGAGFFGGGALIGTLLGLGLIGAIIGGAESDNNNGTAIPSGANGVGPNGNPASPG
jgi:hypothetical protein